MVNHQNGSRVGLLAIIASLVIALVTTLSSLFYLGTQFAELKATVDQHTAWINARGGINIDARLAVLETQTLAVQKQTLENADKLDRLEDRLFPSRFQPTPNQR